MTTAPTDRRRTRLPPEARRRMILDAAAAFFAERGFSAQTRELAAEIGISEALIYNYFSSKEDLIGQVFREVIDSRWDEEWIDSLKARDVPLRDRLLSFYESYLEAIDDQVWIRIVMHASLNGLDMTRRYITDKVDEVMSIIASESQADRGVEQVDREHVWQLQSTLIYYLVRRHIHLTSVHTPRSDVIALAVDTYLSGLPQASV